jgi:hypothetical protein
MIVKIEWTLGYNGYGINNEGDIQYYTNEEHRDDVFDLLIALKKAHKAVDMGIDLCHNCKRIINEEYIWE